MKELEKPLRGAGIATSSLRPLFKTAAGTVYGLTVRGSKAIDNWHRLRDLTTQTGHWPILLGDDGERKRLTRDRKDLGEDTIAGILRKGSRVALRSLFARWHREKLQDVKQLLKDFEEDAKLVSKLQKQLDHKKPFQGMPRGPWPRGAKPPNDFHIPYNLSGKPHRRIHMGLVPTQESWHVPAFLNFGGRNYCPVPRDHVAVMKYWQDNYGAEVVGITQDIVEMLVARPPRTRAQALELAREQFLYCSDIVLQGTETLDVLAALLLRGTTWFFWWD